MAVSVIVRRASHCVVLVGEGHVLAIEGEEAVVADRYAMGVAPEIPQDGGGATEGGFGIDHPVGLKERIDAADSPRLARSTESNALSDRQDDG